MTPLVLVHGFMGGSDQWQLQSPLGNTRDLIRVDLPGFGKNADAPPIDTIAGFADWVLQKLSRLDIHRFDLLGHSMGGMIVQEMMHIDPTRINRLILYGTGPVGALPGRFEPVETSMQRARADGPKATARRIAAKWFRDGDASAQYPACARIAELCGLPAQLAGLQAMRDWSGRAHLGKINAETLIVWGDKDRSYPWSQVEELWTSISHSHLAIVPNASHAVHLERPALFNMLVEDFLADDGSAKP